MDIIGCPRIEDDGTKENAGGQHRADFKADRRGHSAKGVQSRTVPRYASLKSASQTHERSIQAPPLSGALLLVEWEWSELFERFLRQVNKLQAQQRLEAQAQTCDWGVGRNDPESRSDRRCLDRSPAVRVIRTKRTPSTSSRSPSRPARSHRATSPPMPPAERFSSPAAARWSLPSRWPAAIRRVTSISPPARSTPS